LGMGTLIEQFADYVTEVTGLPVAWRPRAPELLPHYLAQRYSIGEVEVGGHRFLGIALKDGADFTPAVFEKQLSKVAELDGFEGYCLIAESLSAYAVKSLQKRRIPFVIPGQQMNWPELGLAVRARKAKAKLQAVKAVSPATQAVLVGALTGQVQQPATPTMLAERLRYTPMTMSRALDEIEATGIGQIRRDGRERLLEFPTTGRELWQTALPYLRNPIQKTVRVLRQNDEVDTWVRAGETALAELSMLAPPKEPEFAIGRAQWKEAEKEHRKIPFEEHGTCVVQVWKYDPDLFAQTGRVDAFSLYLTLMDSQDARVQDALNETMERTAWS